MCFVHSHVSVVKELTTTLSEVNICRRSVYRVEYRFLRPCPVYVSRNFLYVFGQLSSMKGVGVSETVKSRVSTVPLKSPKGRRTNCEKFPSLHLQQDLQSTCHPRVSTHPEPSRVFTVKLKSDPSVFRVSFYIK